MHRDLKPSNVLLTLDRHVRIADFGLSRPDSVTMRPLTVNAGTPAFTAPEVLDVDMNVGLARASNDGSRRYTNAVDVYSFAVCLWQMLVGLRPYNDRRETLNELKVAVAHGLRPVIPDAAPAPLGALIHEMWHPDPARRPSFASIVPRFGAGLCDRQETWAMLQAQLSKGQFEMVTASSASTDTGAAAAQVGAKLRATLGARDGQPQPALPWRSQHGRG